MRHPTGKAPTGRRSVVPAVSTAGRGPGVPSAILPLRPGELTALSDVSVHYLSRLAQGRATVPSAQVVETSSWALRLSGAEAICSTGWPATRPAGHRAAGGPYETSCSARLDIAAPGEPGTHGLAHTPRMSRRSPTAAHPKHREGDPAMTRIALVTGGNRGIGRAAADLDRLEGLVLLPHGRHSPCENRTR